MFFVSFRSTQFVYILRLLKTYVTEYAHSWGAQHDGLERDEDGREECLPDYSEGGNYIMHMYAQNGYDPNNIVSAVPISLVRPASGSISAFLTMFAEKYSPHA